ncbi:MAG: zinc-binding dehydrogenase, partial [Solirubrobacterales bacterium]
MRAAWYERQGPAREVLEVGDLPDPHPAAGEVRVRVSYSGINPGDVKKRGDWLGFGMAYPRVIPHSDGAGEIDAVGAGVPSSRLGERVWVHGAQSYRPFGTAAEYAVVPATQAVQLPVGLDLAQGACLGIPAITAHRAVFADGAVEGLTLLVAGAAGAVGSMAVQLAAWGGARVVGTVTRLEQFDAVRDAGAEHVFLLGRENLVEEIREVAPTGV